MKKILLALVACLLISNIAYAAPFAPALGGTGTSTPPSTGDLLIGNSSNNYQLLHIGNPNNCLIVSGGTPTWSSSCGSGGGSGGGTWSTTTSNVSGELNNYSNNNTDIVNIGGSATTSSKFYFDPNLSASFLSGSTTLQKLTVWQASTTDLFATVASTSLFWGANLSSCTGNNFLQWSTTGLFSCAAGNVGTVTSVTAGYPIFSSGGATPNITFDWSTTTNLTAGSLIMASGKNTFNQVGTSSASCSSGVSCSSFTVVGGVSPSITNNGVTQLTAGTGIVLSGTTGNDTISQSSYVATSTAETRSYVPFWTTTNGTPAGLSSVATGTITCTGTASCGTGSYVLGSNLTITGSGGSGGGLATSSLAATFPVILTTNSSNATYSFGGLGTSSPLSTQGQLLAVSGVNSIYPIGTSSESCTSPVSCTSFNVVGNGGSISLNNLTVSNGGTGQTTFGQGWIYSSGGTGALNSSTSPTVNYLVATGTVASILPYASTTALTVSTLASTTNLIVSSLGSTGTTCVQANGAGLLSSTGSACGAGGGGGTGLATSSLAATFPILLTTNSSNATYSFGGLSTSSAAVTGNVPYFSGVSTFANEATGTVTCTGSASCGAGSYVLGNNLTITGTTGSNGTVDYFAGTTTTGSALPVSTTTYIGAGQSMFVWATCAMPNNLPTVNYTDYLDLGNPGGGTTTISSQGSNQPSGNGSSFSYSGFYTATTTGKLFIALDRTQYTGLETTNTCNNPSLSYLRLNSVGSVGSGGSNWNEQYNYNALNLTPTSTIPVWIKAPLYASSSEVVAGQVTADTFNATNTLATSTFKGDILVGANAISGVQIDASAGFVGVASSSPFAPVSVNGLVAASRYYADIASATSTFKGFITSSRLDSSGNATNTAAQGWNITNGCFAINGTCVGGGGSGSGTVNSSSQGYTTFYNANGTTVSGTSTLFFAQNQNIGVGTTSPQSALDIYGGTYVETASSSPFVFDFCTAANSQMIYATSTNNTIILNNANKCVGKTMVFNIVAPASGVIGTTTFKNNTGSGVLMFDGGIDPGSSVVNGTTDRKALTSMATATDFISEDLIGNF